MPPYIYLLLFGALVIAWIIGRPYWRAYQRQRLQRKPFPAPWRTILHHRVPYCNAMPADLQKQLQQHIQVFVAEKEFIGLQGVVITDEIKVTIAAQACLLLLNRDTDYYPKLNSILVYPRAFIKQHMSRNGDGVHFSQQVVLSGESWGFGKIVLSWHDAAHGAIDPHDGHNVVIHEFAHQLDQATGSANGAPMLGPQQNYEQWAGVFTTEFERLHRDIETGNGSIFDSYGATNPAEFFAVASEVFFEKAVSLKQRHPEIYQQLGLFYRVDPASW